MNICVTGWYFHRPLIEALERSKYRSFFVCHRQAPDGVVPAARSAIIPNAGLEFGCYDWYLKNIWKGGAVLFLHDDNEISEAALEAIADIGHDQAFLFSSEQDAKANGKAHGRAFFCSEKLLARLKRDGGFWYDEAYTPRSDIPATSAELPDYHNAGIKTFASYLQSLPASEFLVSQVLVIPGLITGYRGKLAATVAPKPERPNGRVKLNLCCGNKPIQGYVNIDVWPGPGVDVVCDIRELQYEDSSADEAILFHCLEHFSLDDACAILRKVFRWIKPGGHIIVEGPDIVKCCQSDKFGDFDKVQGVYGDLKEIRKGKEGYAHKWGWTGSLMQQEMASAGYLVSKVENGLSHGHEWRDYRVVGWKPKGG